MDAPTYVRKQIATMRRFYQGTLKEMTDEQFNWIPPGTANSIKASLIHLLAGEDMNVQRVLQGKPLLWDAEGWNQKIGVEVRPGRDQGWDAIRETTIALAPVLEYAQAVHAATDEYLAELTPEELERKVDFFVPDARVADVLSILAVHVAAHSGEIAALRGIQGVKGLPM
ncbi:MAG TPA: DinB family protein [Ktedonobacterales bacterium]